jgi:hypothetical protein
MILSLNFIIEGSGILQVKMCGEVANTNVIVLDLIIYRTQGEHTLHHRYGFAFKMLSNKSI